MPVVSASPANGTSITQGTGTTPASIPFEMKVAQPLGTTMFFEVSTQNVPGQDGTLANDYVVQFGSLSQSDAYPDTYRGSAGNPYGWVNQPGTYYWQAYSYTGSYISDVYTITVAPAQAPQPTPTPTPPVTPSPQPEPVPQFLGASEYKRVARSIIRKQTRRAPKKVRVTRCSQYSNPERRCLLSWYDRAYIYAGYLRLTETETQYLYTFKGSRSKVSCLRKYKSAKRGVRKCSRSYRW